MPAVVIMKWLQSPDAMGVAECRSELANADAEQVEEKEDDFVKGFKVANFEIIESPDKGMWLSIVFASCIPQDDQRHVCIAVSL